MCKNADKILLSNDICGLYWILAETSFLSFIFSFSHMDVKSYVTDFLFGCNKLVTTSKYFHVLLCKYVCISCC